MALGDLLVNTQSNNTNICSCMALGDLLVNTQSNNNTNICSCMALGDLLVSRQVGEIANYIPQLWELVLRVRDDIKVSTLPD